jgi:hypothetical protein
LILLSFARGDGVKYSFQISKPRGSVKTCGAFSIFSTKLSIQDWRGLKGHGEVVWIERDEGFRGLTSVFADVFDVFIFG